MLPSLIYTILFGATLASSFSLRSSTYGPARREAEAGTGFIETPSPERFDEALLSYLEKRRGGGSGRGGSSGSSGSTSSGSSGSTSSGSSGSRSGSGRLVVQSTLFAHASNGHSSSGSSPSYGGGRYYGGGATTPYRSGGRSPAGRLAPYALGGAALGIFPGLWLAGAYGYNYNNPYRYRNRCNNNNNNTENLPVVCLCEKDRDCGCDDDGDTTKIDELVGNGCESDQDPTQVRVGDVNGTKTVVINGTIPYDSDDSDESSDSSPISGAMRQYALEMSGYWIAGVAVLATVLT